MESILEVSSAKLAAGAVAVAAGAYYLASRPSPIPPPCPLDRQSVEVEGQDGAHISTRCKDGKLLEYLYDDVTTTYEGFQRGIRLTNGTGRCLGWRAAPEEPYQWMTYQQVHESALRFGSGLLEKGLSPGQDTFVGIFSQNRPEWVIAEQACSAFSMVVVPLYDTLGPQAIKFVIEQANLHTIVCDVEKKVSSILDNVQDLSTVKRIVLMEKITDELKKRATSLGVEIMTFDDVEEAGRKNPHDAVPPRPEDLLTICYTSGTTGVPKGVMLTHRNIITNISAVLKHVEGYLCLGPDDMHVSYLPLPHQFERSLHVMFFMTGVQIGFFGGDVKKLLDDFRVLRPTIFPSVPRLLNRIYDKVHAGVQGSAIKKKLLEIALRSKCAEVKRGIVRRDSIWDTLIFGKVQNLLGGRVRCLITGSAPLSETAITFLRAALGCAVYEGYGQTEANAGVSFSTPGDHSTGHVGSPLTCNLIKLVDIPEMDYYTRNNQGEVCAKGPNIMKGYYKAPERTAEALDEDGWLHTGDVGEWLPNGVLKIIDRKKHIFKLAQGEYIAPEKVESIYTSSPLVAQAFVHGESLKASCVGVFVPDPEVLPGWAKNNLNLKGTMQELCMNKTVKDAILEEVTSLGRQRGLHSFEQVKAVHLHPELFSLENGLLTPTFKSKRSALKSTFQSQIDEMYQNLA
ncbi:PREDICTED: long-chain-fatty-acid--CoA ligase 1-like [Branchiostoma belcheri]|uniref:Long-chain-fatty-acid--CoA ligase n=1 Tax=Branchiostoma belcheri TaxID=7741 RepID=A0A6P5A1L0_BRABE|nr:PREDICTED: long-chain-fatty-acid--CoA ligase 1-like [Branchiostoma belcheri]